MNLIFLDIDGVLNCQLFYEEQQRGVGSYIENQICRERVSWLNSLCKDCEARVVISSTWRMGRTVEEIREIFLEVGATFDIIDKTPVLRDEGYVRGNEIQLWIEKNIERITGLSYFDFHTYAIIDDDSDMLYTQRNNLFLTDSYAGLTPNTCYRIKQFFKKQYFPNI